MRTFSIVIPTCNGADFIEQALLSALNQTRKADEIIVSDDNSSDQTMAICQKYKDKIRIYHNPNGPSGFVNGWNKAITYATGEYISILHQDDLLAPTFLEEVEKALCIYPKVRHFFVPCNYIDGEGISIQEPDYCDNLIHQYTGKDYVIAYQTMGHPHIHRCPGVITHKDIFKVCPYREEAGHIADDDFFYNLLVQRLAKDYLYQIKQWKNSSFIDKRSYAYFVRWAKYYIFSEYWIGVKQKNRKLIIKGKKDLCELENVGEKLPLKMKMVYFFTSLFFR